MNRRFQTTFCASLLAASVFAAACQPTDTARNDKPPTIAAAASNERAPASSNANDISIADKTTSVGDSASAGPTPSPSPTNAACPDPKNPCHHKDKTFDDWELSFRLPGRIKPNTTYKSAPFYAIILKEYKNIDPESECDGGEYTESIEGERKRIQSVQLTRKVFADHQCPNMAAVGYDFPGRSDGEQLLVANFVAIYAGDTQDEADVLLNELRAEFPRAVVKRMTASYEQIEQ